MQAAGPGEGAEKRVVGPSCRSCGGRAAPLPPALEESLPVRVYTTGEGLAGNEVNAILQDSRGFLWIGTQGGLVRYDGYQFRVYRENPSDPRSLSGSYVR